MDLGDVVDKLHKLLSQIHILTGFTGSTGFLKLYFQSPDGIENGIIRFSLGSSLCELRAHKSHGFAGQVAEVVQLITTYMVALKLCPLHPCHYTGLFAEGNGNILTGIRPVKIGFHHPVDPVDPV